MGRLPHLRALRIRLVTPDATGPLGGNRVTASRWARLLRELGHGVAVGREYGGQPCDVLVALHARRSFAAVERFRRERPRGPLVVALTGTDLYRDLSSSPPAQRSLELATRLVVLQPLALERLRRRWRRKARVIVQSAERPRGRVARRRDRFEMCQIGHLREVKDPFRVAEALRGLPARSRARLLHVGAALDPGTARRARSEMQANGRYRWLGALPRARTLRLLARSRLLVLPSRLEGGANVVSEALACGVPVISSRIEGSMGLLGRGYPGYFPVGDTAALAALLERVESDRVFYGRLRRHCRRRAALVKPAREKRGWAALLRELV